MSWPVVACDPAWARAMPKSVRRMIPSVPRRTFEGLEIAVNEAQRMTLFVAQRVHGFERREQVTSDA